MNTIWICFTNDTTVKWLRFLKQGFRHCFALMECDGRFVYYEPMASRTDIGILPVDGDFNMRRWLKEQGITAIKFEQTADSERPMRIAPIGLFTCVEAVKRLLGIHLFCIQTPWQLYRYLCNKKNLT